MATKSTGKENLSYIVKPGDTLFNIAKRYNISVNEIKPLNWGLVNIKKLIFI